MRFLGSLAAFVLVLASTGASRAEKATLDVKAEETYGRIVIGFPDRNILPTFKINADNGVLVVQFDEVVDLDVDRVSSVLGRFVTIARADPEGKGARFALARRVKVNTMEAGAKLFLDLLPADWVGPPPRLPDDVVVELARKAEEAAKAAREAEVLRVAGTKTARMDLRVARGPTFSRFVFKWNIPFDAEFHREDATVGVSFNRQAAVDIAPVKADLPPFVDDIATETTPDGTTVRLTVQPVADVRAFREEDSYVVDVQGPIDPHALSPLDQAVHAAVGDDHDVPAGATERVTARGVAQDGHGADAHAAPTAAHTPTAHAAPRSHEEALAPTAPVTRAVHAAAPEHAPAPPAHATVAPAAHASETHEAPDAEAHPATKPPTKAPHGETAAHEVPVDRGHGASGAGNPAKHSEHAIEKADGPESIVAPETEAHGPAAAHNPPEPAAAHAEPSESAKPQLAELPEGTNDRVLADGVIRVEAKRIGQATRLVFPYPHRIGSALFSRGPAIWLVFDDPAPIDPAPLQDALAGFARSIEPRRIGEAQAIRIELADQLLSTLTPDGTYWVVTIGDMVMEPTRPLPVKRAVRGDGTTALDVPFGPVSAIHHLRDSAAGDTIVVVTGEGEPRGLIKPQGFAEVDALSSAHGLAFVPKVDDLAVRAEGELVSIERPGGLSVSTIVPPKRSAGLDLQSAIGSSAGGRSGYVDFADTEAGDPADFWKKRHALMAQIAETRDKVDRVDRWYRVAKFNVANGLGPEAMGVLNLIATISPEEETAERMAVLRAGASMLIHRPKEVLSLLDGQEFAESPDAAVWKTIAYAELGDYTAARKMSPRAESVIGSFPSVIQKRFLLAGVATAIELNDYGKARSLLAEIDPRALTESERAELDLLNARAIDASGHAADAIAVLSEVVRKERGPVAAEATYRLVRMQRREGLITLDQALDRLEQLAVAWRGDQIELNTLRTLGQYSVEKGNFRRAFEVMRAAQIIDSQSETTRLMQEEMQAAFASLYLDGMADKMKPVDALALYYDFRELTPPGRRGDAMVRKLADRLVDIDLLPQAEQLLTYQVENRLRGAARAQVAADLALVYLLDRRPDRALLTLSRSRQSELPVSIERQRRLVEARALADTGKVELALDLVKPLAGADVERLRAEMLWGGERYAAAGAQFERLLGGRWHDDLPLSEAEQLDVLKAGIAFTLADDRLGVDRLRGKYTAKMAATPNSSAFDAVTGPIVANGANFDEVVRSVAAVDTMDGFLADYRKRYLELGTGDKPEIVGQETPTAAAGEATPPAG